MDGEKEGERWRATVAAFGRVVVVVVGVVLFAVLGAVRRRQRVKVVFVEAVVVRVVGARALGVARAAEN